MAQPTQVMDAILDEVKSIYHGEFGHDFNPNNPMDLNLAASRWLSANFPGVFVGGFFNGEQGKNANNQIVFGIVAIVR